MDKMNSILNSIAIIISSNVIAIINSNFIAIINSNFIAKCYHLNSEMELFIIFKFHNSELVSQSNSHHR